MLAARITCLAPVGTLVLMALELHADYATTIATALSLTGPGILLLGWALLRGRHMHWHASVLTLTVGVAGMALLVGAEVAMVLLASTSFFSFSAVFLGLSSLPLALIGAIGIVRDAPPILYLHAVLRSPAFAIASGDAASRPEGASPAPALPAGCSTAAGSAANTAAAAAGTAVPSTALTMANAKSLAVRHAQRRRWLLAASLSYAMIMAAYAGVGAVRRDVAPYAAAAASACVLLYDALALALMRRGAIRANWMLIALCGSQRLILIALGPNYIDEAEAFVFLLNASVAAHGILKKRWGGHRTTDSFGRFMHTLHAAPEATGRRRLATGTHWWSQALARAKAYELECHLAATCAAHLVLLLILLALLPADALPPSRLTDGKHSQPLAGLVAFAALVALIGTELFLRYWHRRGHHLVLVWLCWWAYLLGTSALVDLTLIRHPTQKVNATHAPRIARSFAYVHAPRVRITRTCSQPRPAIRDYVC